MYGAAEEGLVYFSLMRASNLPKAFAEARCPPFLYIRMYISAPYL